MPFLALPTERLGIPEQFIQQLVCLTPHNYLRLTHSFGHILEILFDIVIGNGSGQSHGRHSIRIGKIGVGAVASQQGDDFAASARIENGFRQWRVAVGIPRINRGSRSEQGLGYFDRVRLGSEVKGSPAIVVG